METSRRRLVAGMGLLGVACAWPVWARDGLLMGVALDQGRDVSPDGLRAMMRELSQYFSDATGQKVQVAVTQNPQRMAEDIRANKYDALLAPAHHIGTAMRHGYQPVARTARAARVALVARPHSGIESFDAARGKRLALPHPDSLVAYMVRGEFNAQGISPARHFTQVVQTQQYGATLYAAEAGMADLVAVEERDANDWVARHPGARIVKLLPEIPLAGVAVDNRMEADVRERLATAAAKLELQRGAWRDVAWGRFERARAADFELVSTRGYFTPEVLPGVRIVTAPEVRKLVADGVPLFDVRPSNHRQSGLIEGAKSVPYVMNSAKDIDADDSVDRFDLSQLPQDKKAPIIVHCNGGECWYSYKAARYLLKRGYQNVMWFRGGVPEWRAAGYPLLQGG